MQMRVMARGAMMVGVMGILVELARHTHTQPIRDLTFRMVKEQSTWMQLLADRRIQCHLTNAEEDDGDECDDGVRDSNLDN